MKKRKNRDNNYELIIIDILWKWVLLAVKKRNNFLE